MVRGLFFDLYGTLLLYGDMDAAWDSWLGALHEALTPRGLRLDREGLSRACDGLFSGPDPSPLEGHTLYEGRIVELTGRFGIELDAVSLRRIADATVAAWQEHVTLDPETRPLLEWLRPRVRLAVVTNFDHSPHVHRVLERFELVELLDCVVISGAVGVRKPDPAIFSGALEATGLAPDQIAFVGDAPEDVAGARAAGMTPICIRRDGAADPSVVVDYRADDAPRETGPDEPEDALVIRRLDDLRDLVTRWERSDR